MAASYPSSAKSFTTKTDGAGQTIFAAHVNDLQDEVVALETALISGGVAHGLKPSVAGAQDLGTASLPWGTVRTRALNFDAVSSLTIAAGVVTVTRSHHSLDTEAAAATDDLDTLTATGLTDGFVVVLRPANVARVVTVKDGTGNLLLNGDYALNATDRSITLLYDGTNWRELARSGTTYTRLACSADSGTDTNAAAANVATCAIAGLSALDTLEIVVSYESITQQTAGLLAYSSTDAVTLTDLSGGALIPAARSGISTGTLRIKQGSTTVGLGLTSGNSTANGVISDGRAFTIASWTGAWTLALRHTGVTAGGTFKYSWAVYIRRGQ